MNMAQKYQGPQELILGNSLILIYFLLNGTENKKDISKSYGKYKKNIKMHS